ncbi:unnamed protein product [Lota lota]
MPNGPGTHAKGPWLQPEEAQPKGRSRMRWEITSPDVPIGSPPGNTRPSGQGCETTAQGPEDLGRRVPLASTSSSSPSTSSAPRAKEQLDQGSWNRQTGLTDRTNSLQQRAGIIQHETA